MRAHPVVSILSLVFALVWASAPAMGQPEPEPEQRSIKVINWNVLYGFNHANSIEEGVAWIRDQQPQVLALQELNGSTHESLSELAQRWGHEHSAILKENGFPVGLTSAEPIEVIERRVDGFHHGYLHAKTYGIHFFIVHFWPGKDHEARVVLDRIAPLLASGERVIVLGDFNTNSRKDAGFLANSVRTPSYGVVDLLEENGFVDLVHKHDEAAKYSCPSPITIPRWSEDMAEIISKRQRIDFVFADQALAASSTSGTIVINEEIEAISDHYPVVVELAISRPQGRPPAGEFSFGVIADCQYCDVEGTGVRKYSKSVAKLEACVEHLNTLELEFSAHLGDFIDRDFESFEAVLPVFAKLKAPGYHVLGNHDFSVADEKKALVPEKLGMPSRYYSYSVQGWRFVVLDGNDVSFYAYPEGSAKYLAAAAYYEAIGSEPPKWNGAVGPEQLEWLKGELATASDLGERVVLLCHFPVFPEAGHNLWNAEEVIEVIESFSCVKMYLNGHNHAGGYEVKRGVHYLTIKGMVDTEESSYAVIRVTPESLEVSGFGREIGRTLRVQKE